VYALQPPRCSTGRWRRQKSRRPRDVSVVTQPLLLLLLLLQLLLWCGHERGVRHRDAGQRAHGRSQGHANGRGGCGGRSFGTR
jgi:hypothetical protein